MSRYWIEDNAKSFEYSLVKDSIALNVYVAESGELWMEYCAQLLAIL